MPKKIKLATAVTDECVHISYKLGNWTMLSCYKLHTAAQWTITTTITLPKFIQAELGGRDALYPEVKRQSPPTLPQALGIQKELKRIADKQMAYLRINRLQQQLDKQMALHIEDMHGDHVQSHNDQSNEDLVGPPVAPPPPSSLLKVLGRIDLSRVKDA